MVTKLTIGGAGFSEKRPGRTFIGAPHARAGCAEQKELAPWSYRGPIPLSAGQWENLGADYKLLSLETVPS